MLESDLFLPIKVYLISNGFKVSGETLNCDIVAQKDETVIIVELKRSLTVELLVQAVKRQKMTEYVYIGIPKKKVPYRKWQDLLHLVKRLELGLIVVDENNVVEVVLEPSIIDRQKILNANKRKRNKLLTEMDGRTIDYNIGGSTGKKIMTAYKDQSLYIASCFALCGPLSPKQLRAIGADQKKTTSILSKNYNNWFYRVKNGLYDLTEQGKKALEQHSEIVQIHKEKIMKKL